MAFDDPIVWVLILGVVIFMFGSSKIPQFAKALGQARKEFDNGFKGITSEFTSPSGSIAPASAMTTAPAARPSPAIVTADPVITAAQNEGIETVGKTRQEIAAELAWKLNKR
jgi:sec-independent protein translocase protein TatA